MTDHKLEEILKQSLGQEIKDQDIFLYKRERVKKEHKRKYISKAGLAFACLAIVFSVVFGRGLYLKDNMEPKENPFTITVNAAELTERQSVPLLIDGASKHGGVVCGGKDKESIFYHIASDFGCMGENMKSITYRINKGAFCIQELQKGACIIDYKEADIEDIDVEKNKFDRIGELIASTEDMEGFDIPGTEFVENRMPRKCAKYYATEYTVAYDNQMNDTTLIGIYGFVQDKNLFEKLFCDDYEELDWETACSELLKDIKIECIVTYENGHQKRETIGFEAAEFPEIEACDSLVWNMEIDYVLEQTDEQTNHSWMNKDYDRVVFANDIIEVKKGEFLTEIIENMEQGKSKEEVINDSVKKIVSKKASKMGMDYENVLGGIEGRDEINIRLIAEWLYNEAIKYSVYYNVINTIKKEHILPNCDTEIMWDSDVSIFYAIEDINQDGVMEFLIKLNYGSGPDGGILLYKYDGDNNMSICQIGKFGEVCHFYDNGIIEEELSHGSPYGGPYNNVDDVDTFWPYQVWNYQTDTTSYKRIGFVTDWNKNEWSDSVGNYSSFPTDIDKDKDGIVYLLTDKAGEEQVIDYIDLEKWKNSYRKESKEILINYQIIK